MPETEYRLIQAKYDGTCARCGAQLPAGTKIRYYADSKKAYCAGDHRGQPKQAESHPDSLVEFPPPESPETPPVAREWGYEQRDRLMARESCVKSACNMIAAAIEAGIYKPDVEEQRFSRTVMALSEALERWVLAALDGTD